MALTTVNSKNPLMQDAEAPARGDVAAIARLGEARLRLKEQIGRIIVGQDAVVDNLLTAMFSRGHALIVGVPGLAKTLMVRTSRAPWTCASTASSSLPT